MNKLLLIGALVSVLNISAQETTLQPNCDDIDGIEMPAITETPALREYKYTGIAFTCINGKVETLETFKDGESDGLFRWWNTDGQLINEATYVDGNLEGTMREWYDNGQLFREAKFKEGELVVEKCWDEKGEEIECPKD